MLTRETIIDYFVTLAQNNLSSAHERMHIADELKENYAKLKTVNVTRTLSEKERAIYGVTRMAGTLAVMSEVLQILSTKTKVVPQTILDCGSGPGTALFASFMEFGAATSSYTALEKDVGFITMAQTAIAELLPHDAHCFNFLAGMLPTHEMSETFDLSIMSYVLSETPANSIADVVKYILQRTKKFVVITDAGTPLSYRQMMTARTTMIDAGWKIIAPCPHQLSCPMAGYDFCHFPARFERHDEMRRLKRASANAEDEKYSYLIAIAPDEKTVIETADRIVSRPLKRTGHVIIDVCSREGTIERKIVSKKNGDAYTRAKKLAWGDELTHF